MNPALIHTTELHLWSLMSATLVRGPTQKLSDAGGPARTNRQHRWPARIRSSDLVSDSYHHTNLLPFTSTVSLGHTGGSSVRSVKIRL